MEIKFLTPEQALYLFAAVTTIVSALVTLVAHTLRGTKDPFLKFYVVVIFGVSVILWLILKWSQGATQLDTIKMFFLFVAALGTINVISRSVSVYFHVRSGSLTGKPFGLYNPYSDWWPYFLLIIAWALMSLWLILYYTVPQESQRNRLDILVYFGYMGLYLVLCRIAWSVIDNYAIQKMRASSLNRDEKMIPGILRAVHLDEGWVEVKEEKEGDVHLQIFGLGEEMHGRIGAMLNRSVEVRYEVDESGLFRFGGIKVVG